MRYLITIQKETRELREKADQEFDEDPNHFIFWGVVDEKGRPVESTANAEERFDEVFTVLNF